MASWRVIVAQYASAIQLWSRAAELCGLDPWPPSRGVLDAYAFFFKHGPSLSRYLSHIRSALRLLEAPVGVLAETTKIICGAMIYAKGVRFKPRADAEQTSTLMNCARKDFGRSDIADNWLVARHFCLRYGAEVVPMQTAGNHSAVHVAEEKEALPVVTLALFRREAFLLLLWGVAASAGCRMNIVRRLRSQVSSGKHSLVFLMCCALKALRT